MIDTLLNAIFRCRHGHLTRPVTPVCKAGDPHGDAYVSCLDCGKRFAYDVKEMRIGKPLEAPRATSVLPEEPGKRGRKPAKPPELLRDSGDNV